MNKEDLNFIGLLFIAASLLVGLAVILASFLTWTFLPGWAMLRLFLVLILGGAIGLYLKGLK